MWGNYRDNKTTNYEGLNCLWAKHEIVAGKEAIAKKYNLGGIKDTDYPKGDDTAPARIELSTGASDDFKRYNIYDMAGNMWEWTTGHNISNGQMFLVLRGGSFYEDGATPPVVRAKGGDELTHCYISVGFRVVLYVK